VSATGAQPAPPAGCMDGGQYSSTELHELEMRRLFGRGRVYAGDALDIAEPGDYRTETIGHEPVVAVRGADGWRGAVQPCSH
jgi:phenylpropionate dioxygenase-like ring-hydroxylating dioxygenase large terminal subunit